MRPAAVALALAGCGAEYDIVAPVDVDPAEVTECAFEPLEERPAFQVYTCNPVFEATDEPWAEQVSDTAFTSVNVLDHPFYQLWYFGIADGVTQVGTAVSVDGTTWTASPDNPGFPDRGARDWDGADLQSPRVAWDPDAQAYWMLYGGISEEAFFGVGLAGSRDGVQWDLLPENPILSLSAPYDGVTLAWPLAFAVADDGYDAWFAATRGPDTLSVYRMHTDDVRQWTVPAEKVLGTGDEGAWDDTGFVDTTLVELDGVEYLFYVGFGEWVDAGTVRYTSEQFLGLARREAGGEWERVGDGLVPVNLTREGEVAGVAARAIGTRIHLWITDQYDDLGARAVGYYLYDPTEDDR